MREILFRGIARDFNSRDWFYGSLLDKVYGGYPAILTDAAIEDDGTLFVQPIYVERDSIGQYTGLKDKNGKKIFEGDLTYYPWSPGKVLMKVVFIDGEFRLYPVKNYDFKVWDIRICGEQDNIEVIGNIYDNPELLEDN